MKIKWLGHASVLITSDSGLKIITDPYEPGPHSPAGGTLLYKDIDESADIIVVTHEHPDHNYVSSIKGNPEIVRGAKLRETGPAKVKGIEFMAIPCYHDGVEGKIFGANNIVCFEIDGLRICHIGDLGHTLSDEQLAKLGNIDILLLCVGLIIPVGERKYRTDESGKREPYFDDYIVNADFANSFYNQVSPKVKVIIPIHYGNERCTFKLVNVEEFLKGKKNVVRTDASEVEVKREKLPAETQIIVVQPAL